MKKILAIMAMMILVFIPAQDQRKAAYTPLSSPSDHGIYKIKCGSSTGTGVMVSPRYMTTAAHVVGKSRVCNVQIEGVRPRTITLTVVRVEQDHDFALLRSKENFPDHRMINCDGIYLEDSYAIAGYPFGGPFKVSEAEPIDRYYNTQDGPKHLRAMDSNTHRGMSGGPVIQSDGRVVGYLVGEMRDGTRNDVVKEYRDVSVCDPR